MRAVGALQTSNAFTTSGRCYAVVFIKKKFIFFLFRKKGLLVLLLFKTRLNRKRFEVMLNFSAKGIFFSFRIK